MSFWAELKRRNVVKVGLTYAVAAWLAIQMVTTVMPTFDAPPWIARAITFILILGLPFVLAFAWAFELTPAGLQKTEDVPAAESTTALTSTRLNYLIMGLLAAAVVFMAVERYWFTAATDEDAAAAASPAAVSDEARAEPPAAAPAVTPAAPDDAQPLPNSVAVIPFANLSPREDEAYFAAGIHDEILNQLVKLKSLNVIARTSVLQYAGTNKTISEIGRELGVETVMEGSVRYADGRVLVTTQLVDARTNVHLWSESYERDFANIFAVQADIAMNVANALQAEFTPAEQESIERLPTASLEAYELYLTAQERSRAFNTNAALEAIDAALELDPSFAQAWATKAAAHSARLQSTPFDRYAAEQDAMFTAAQRAAELAPDLPEAQALLASAYSRRGEWAAADAAFRKAGAAAGTPAGTSYALHFASVGEIERAHELNALARRTDPFNQTVRAFHLLGFGILGDFARAEQEFERGTAAFGEPWRLGSWFITMVRARPGQALSSADVLPGMAASSPQNDIPQYLDSPAAGLAMLHERARDRNYNISSSLVIAVWAAYFGDAEFALETLERPIGLNAQNAFHLWIPAMREVRQLPRFKELMREIGLVDYWREQGWPTLCRPAGGEDFVCI